MSDSPTADARLPSAKELQRLIRFEDERQQKIDTLAGEMGSEIALAVEKKNLHKGAFKLSRRLLKMDATKAYAFLAHFDHYREQLKIDDHAGEPLALDEQPQSSRRLTGKDAASEQSSGGDDEAPAATNGKGKGKNGKGAKADAKGGGGNKSTSFRAIGEAGDAVIKESTRRLAAVS